MAKRRRRKGRGLGSAAYRAGWDATFGPKTKTKKCKHGRVKSGARKGLCRLQRKRRRK
jgi:hypothetical protein